MVSLNPNETNGLILAYLGDAVWELQVRTYFINQGYNIKNLNIYVKKHVNGKAQSLYYKKIIKDIDENILNIIRRAKNGNIKVFPKSCTNLEYRQATAFEALIGVLYIENKMNEINKIVEICLG